MNKLSIVALAMSLLAAPACADEKTDLAVRLIAITGFVAEYCVGMEPNLPLLSAALGKLDIDLLKFQQNTGKMVQGQLYIEIMKKDVKTGCKMAWDNFGDDGKIIGGLIEKK